MTHARAAGVSAEQAAHPALQRPDVSGVLVASSWAYFRSDTAWARARSALSLCSSASCGSAPVGASYNAAVSLFRSACRK
ncbi:hypothetical protein [Streptomyces sp. NPDC017524]|uniref:hypothetical protein n=1 Tax=unclassified Streptomyces TaxID=2593676 RepID=UPI00379F6EC4